MLDLMANWTQGGHASQALNTRGLVILPDLMTLDRVSGSATTTYLTVAARNLIDLLANPVPIRRRYLVPNIGEPAALGDELNRQPRFYFNSHGKRMPLWRFQVALAPIKCPPDPARCPRSLAADSPRLQANPLSVYPAGR